MLSKTEASASAIGAQGLAEVVTESVEIFS